VISIGHQQPLSAAIARALNMDMPISFSWLLIANPRQSPIEPTARMYKNETSAIACQ